MFPGMAPDEEATCPVCEFEGRVHELRAHVAAAADAEHARFAFENGGGCLR